MTGARFRGHVNLSQRGIKYWAVCDVVECDPGRAFALNVITGGRALNRWSYHLEPVGDGTDVTESYRLAPTPLLRLYWFFAGPGRVWIGVPISARRPACFTAGR